MDRTIRGLYAGMLAAIPMNLWSYLSFYIIGLTDLRLLDWGAFVIFGNLPQNIVETIVGQATQILWSGFLGIIFSLLIPITTSNNLAVKGAFYGFITGLFIYVIPIVFRIPIFGDPTTGRAVSQAIAGTLWGVSLAYVLFYLNRKSRL